MTQYFIIPGLGNSGPLHWQTWFENSGDTFTRIEQSEWEAPDCNTWVETIELALIGADLQQVVLIAHSMGCVTIAHWAKTYQHRIKGALLVAPSDLEMPAYTFPSTGFTPIPLQKLPFPSIVVASSNDIWVSTERAQQFADAWGSSLVNIGEAGHINADAGYGEWQEGLEILNRL